MFFERLTKSQISIILMCALIASHLVISISVTNILVGLLLILTFFYKSSWQNTTLILRNKTFWILISPFLLYTASLIYSTDLSIGWKEVEKKLPLLIFPLIFGLSNINKKDFHSLLKFTVLLISITPIIGFINQLNTYNSIHDSGLFYNDNLVSIFSKQAVYFSFFVNSAILILIYLWEKDILNTPLEKIVGLMSLLLLIITQYLLASRTSIALTFLILFGFLIWLVLKKLNKKNGLLLFGGSIILITLILFSFPKVLKRFESITNVSYRYDNPNPINHFNGEIKKENWNGLNTRLAIWNCAWDVFLKSPIIGHGLGDKHNLLIENYTEKNFILALKSDYNTHNQYLDVMLSSGAVGLFLFLFFLSYLILHSFKTENYLLLSFTLVFMITILTENMLNRNQGIAFIGLVISLLSFHSSCNNEKSIIL